MSHLSSCAQFRISEMIPKSDTPSVLSPRDFVLLSGAIGALMILLLLPWLRPGDGTHIPIGFQFLGRFHPLILHLPIGWILLSVLLEAQRLPVLNRWFPEASESLKTLLLFLGATSAFVAVLLGWMLSYGGGYESGLLQNHFNAGLWTAIAVDLALICRLFPSSRLALLAYPILLVLGTGTLTLAGHYGASLTHGSDYLTEFAPDFVRQKLGLPVKAVRSLTPPAKGEDHQVYEELIKPALATSCLSCHGMDKAKGGLRLDTFDFAMKGGTDGPVIVSGDPDKSELLRRVHLPVTDENHMPPKGKIPLTDTQIALLTWWIKAGVPEKQTAEEFKPPTETPAQASSVGTAAGSAPVQGATASPEESATGEKVIPITQGEPGPLPAGLPGNLRTIVPNGSDLQYSAGYQFAQVDDTQIGKLSSIAGHIIWLDLTHTPVTDSGLQVLQKMTALQKLELQKTEIGDAALAWVGRVTELQSLNLNGTRVSDQGLPQLASLKKLRRLYLFETAVTDAGEKNLKALLPQVEIIRQLLPAVSPAPAATSVGAMPTLSSPVTKQPAK
jgi:hypothetical protein